MTLVTGIGDEVIYAIVFGTILSIVYFAWNSTQVRDLPSRARLVVTALRTIDGRPQPVFQISRTINIDLPPGLLSGDTQAGELNGEVNAELERVDNPQSLAVENSETGLIQSELEPSSEVSANAETTSESGSEISVKLIFLNDTQKIVKSHTTAKVGEFKRIHFQEASDHTKVVRLIFNGQVLSDESRTLEDYGVFDNCAVHCLIHPNRNVQQAENVRQTDSSTSQPAAGNVPTHLLQAQREGARRFAERGGAIVAEFEIDFGTLLVPLCAIILGFCWYWRFLYNELFNAEATVSLVGLTTLFTGFMFVMYLPIRGVE